MGRNSEWTNARSTFWRMKLTEFFLYSRIRTIGSESAPDCILRTGEDQSGGNGGGEGEQG